MNVNGTAVSPSPSVVLYDLETIDIHYTSFAWSGRVSTRLVAGLRREHHNVYGRSL